jgi:trk system potassium uptake protein TrkH
LADPAHGERPRRVAIWLVETGPLGFAIAWPLTGGGDDWQMAATVGGAAGLSLGGALVLSARRAGGIMMTAGLGALLTALAPALISRPLLGLVLLLAAIGLLARVWSPGILEDLIGRGTPRLRLDVTDIRLTAAIVVTTWLVGVAGRSVLDPWTAGASALASAVAVVVAAAWTRGMLRGAALVGWMLLTAGVTLGVALAAATGAIRLALALLALLPATSLIIARTRGVEVVGTSWTHTILDHPARLVVATFLVLCAVGFVLLSLPVSAEDGVGIAWIDAAFTAVSAVCVTGLITVDTARAWSGEGLAVVLLLIQLGGLGIMTLSTAALGLLGRRLSVRHEEVVAGLYSGKHRGRLFVALRRTLAVTFAAEAAGSVCLALLFWREGDGLAAGLWRGVFTAVSAFCNAGFALQPDSLVAYQHSPAVLHTIAVLIIAGGLSPAVIVALPRIARRKAAPLQVKVVLATSAGLLLLGFGSFASFEWHHALAGMSVADRLHNAWFQSVTFRTAGFNSVDIAPLQGATILLSLVLMFIGGAPGSTAGGIKVTTVWVLGATFAGALRGEPEATSFGRRIPHQVVYRAIAIAGIGALLLAALLTAVLLTQEMAMSTAVFETVSALGTVGLSLGGTAQLDGLGKMLIMIAMFVGRVGPLTAFLLLVERQVAGPRSEQLEENVEVG